MKISDYAIKHPAVIIILLSLLVFFGVFTLSLLTQGMFPDIEGSTGIIVTGYPGVEADDVEEEVTTVLEEILVSIPGLKEMRSTSQNNASVIMLDFDEKTEMQPLLAVIREKINEVKNNLPEEIQESYISVGSVASSLPIMSLTISGLTNLYELTEYVEKKILPQIAHIDGVSQIELIGGVSRELEIQLSLEKLNARNLTVLEIYNILKVSNQSIPAGSTTYRERELSIKTEGEFRNIAEAGSVVIGSKDNSTIFLKDVADISLIEKNDNFLVSSRGKQMLQVDVKRRESSDSIKIIKAINQLINQINKDSLLNIDVSVIKDDSIITGNSLRSVVQAGLIGILMAILVLYLFLNNISATGIIALSLPLCIFISLIGMYLMGQTINILSLSGLTVALGMIVDSSIVVLEQISRKFHVIRDRKMASSQGAGEIGGAVLASTLTTICVFIPLLFLKGIIGIFLKNISLTIISSISASFLVALIVVPFLASRHYKPEKKEKKRSMRKKGKISLKLSVLKIKLNAAYTKALKWSLVHRRTVIFSLVILLLSALIPLTTIGIAFVPSVDTGEIEVFIETPTGYSLEKTRVKVQQIELLLNGSSDNIISQSFVIGMENPENQIRKNNKAYGKINLIGAGGRDETILEIIDNFQYIIDSSVPDVKVVFINGGYDSMLAMGVGGRGFIIDIYSSNRDQLAEAAITIESILALDPDVVKTSSNVNYENREIVNHLLLDQMGNLGITSLEAALTNRIVFNGIKTGVFRNNGNNYDITLSSDLKNRSVTNDLLNQIHLKTPSGETVSFTRFSQFETNPSPSAIYKTDRMETMRITGFINKNETGGIRSRVSETLENMNFPHDFSWEIGGTSALIFDSINSLILVLCISIFLVYAVMVMQFEKFLQPLAIMASIPFCLIGIIFGLKIFGSSITIIAFLGLITLAGIVVNNAIVMIDYINILRKRDNMELTAAIIKGSQSRIRPILMTTLTTMLGVLPLALGRGDGAEFYAPLGQTIFGGLLSSTVITLILIPVLYYIVESRSRT